MSNKTTFHGRDGKFSPAHSAHSATRGGERLKVVRQLRRMGRAPKNENALQAIQRLDMARKKLLLQGKLLAPGYVLVSDLMRG